jgi:hypothetical protein
MIAGVDGVSGARVFNPLQRSHGRLP